MTAHLLDVAAPEWASFLRESPHDFYHLPAYSALSAVHEHGDAKALYVVVDGRRMLLPLILRDIPGSNARDATSPYGYPGPLVQGTDDPGFLSEALAAGMAVLRAAGIVSVFVRLHPLLNATPPEGIGVVVRHHDTISVDLTLPGPSLWAQTRRNHRRDIKKAVQRGFVARIDSDFGQYDGFKRLYRETMDRRAASPYYFFDDAYFEGLRHALRGRLHLCVVEQGEALAAAGLLVETDKIVQYHLAGTDRAITDIEPTKLLVHFARAWAQARGNRWFHLGGGVGGQSDSLLHFKAGFSPLRQPFHTLRIVVHEPEYRRLIKVQDPSPLRRDIGMFFPPYRSE